MIGVVVVNFRQTALTLRCVQSLHDHAGVPFRLVIVDNASDEASASALKQAIAGHPAADLIANAENLGFAIACNQAIEHLQQQPQVSAIALINNDCEIERDALKEMLEHLRPDQRIGMVAARMMQYASRDVIDSLGIVLYKSGIASNRKHPNEPLLGPCGGAGLYSTALLGQLRKCAGHVFDPDFFCYAEDTDLAMRAQALGWHCGYAERAVVYHHGCASSGGGANDFVAFYGLRNSLLAMLQNFPGLLFLRYGLWMVLMQCLVIGKYLLIRRPGLIWRVYRDCLRHFRPSLAKRKRMAQACPSARLPWQQVIARRFYQQGYVQSELRALPRQRLQRAQTGDQCGPR